MKILRDVLEQNLCTVREIAEATNLGNNIISNYCKILKIDSGRERLILDAISKILADKKLLAEDYMLLCMTKKQVIEKLKEIACEYSSIRSQDIYIFDNYSKHKHEVRIDSFKNVFVYIYDDHCEMLEVGSNKVVGDYLFNELGRIFDYINDETI